MAVSLTGIASPVQEANSENLHKCSCTYGVALLSGVAAGMYGNVGEATSVVELREEVTEPDAKCSKAYAEYYQVYRSLYPSQREATHRLSELVAKGG